MRDIKKAYEDIKISEKEKNKIFNNIMENRKKGFSWAPIIGFGAVALASLGIFMVVGRNTNDPTNTFNRNISLENNYKKEIITNAKHYLEANNVDLEELEDGEEIKIEGNKIVDKEEYKMCSGNLVIKRYKDDYSYTPDIQCEGTDNSSEGEKQYVIYSGILDHVFEVDDYIAISSLYNYSKKEITVLDVNTNKYEPWQVVKDNDINLTMVDKNGNVLFNTVIESVFKDEDSKIEVKSINKIDNNYYVALEVRNEINIGPHGGGSERLHYYMLILDEEGKQISYEELLDYFGNRIAISEYLGGEDGVAYYTGYVNNHVIVKISKDNVETIEYKVSEEEENGIAKGYRVEYYADGYFYGTVSEKSYEVGEYFRENKLFKLDMEGNIVWEKTYDLEDEANLFDVTVKNDTIYARALSEKKAYLMTFDLEGEVKNNVCLTDLTDLTFYGHEYYVDGKNINVRIEGTEETHYLLLDENLKLVEEITLDQSEINANFMWSYVAYSRYNGKNVDVIYAVNQSINTSESILLVFNK